MTGETPVERLELVDSFFFCPGRGTIRDNINIMNLTLMLWFYKSHFNGLFWFAMHCPAKNPGKST